MTLGEVQESQEDEDSEEWPPELQPRHRGLYRSAVRLRSLPLQRQPSAQYLPRTRSPVNSPDAHACCACFAPPCGHEFAPGQTYTAREAHGTDYLGLWMDQICPVRRHTTLVLRVRRPSHSFRRSRSYPPPNRQIPTCRLHRRRPSPTPSTRLRLVLERRLRPKLQTSWPKCSVKVAGPAPSPRRLTELEPTHCHDTVYGSAGHIRRGDWAKYAKMCDPEMTCIEPESQNMRVSGLPFHQVSIFCPPASAQAYAVPSQQWTEEQPTQASFD